MQELREATSQDALQIKKLTQCESALYLELADLRQTDKETKRLLFEKSQEALSPHSKVLSLRNEVIELQEKAEETQVKMARLEERTTQQKVQLGQLEGKLVRKDELFSQLKKELTSNVVEAYDAGFEDAMTQVASVHPGVDLSQTGLTKRVVDGQLVDAQE